MPKPTPTARPRRRRRTPLSPLVVAALATSLALGACAEPVDGTTTSANATGAAASAAGAEPAPPATTSDPNAPAAAPVPEALDFVAEDVDGEEFRGADLAGTPTVLWFWAPWCTVCARSAAEVREVADANPGIEVVGVAGLASDRAAMQEFVQRNDVADLTHLADLDGSLYARFGVAQQHSFVLVAADGTTTTEAAYSGQVDLADLVTETFG